MKMTPFTDDLFIGRNYQQNMHADFGLHSSHDRSLVSSTHGMHSSRWGQSQKSGLMPKADLNVLLVEGKGEKLAGKLQERIQVEKVLDQQGMSAMVSQRKAYQKELRAQLQGWEEQVALYRAKAESATDLAREEFYEITAALQRMQDETRMKLQEL